MKKRKVYWQTIIEISQEKEWFSNTDYTRKTKGSPKLTSRISDMRKKGVVFDDRWVENKEEGRHKEYKRITPIAQIKMLMKGRAA